MFTPYKTRAVRLIEIYSLNGWRIKVYSISAKNEFAHKDIIITAKINLAEWLKNDTNYEYENYKITTLIVHEGIDGCYVILNWWLGENMSQQHIYISSNRQPYKFELRSDKGLSVCVWEMAVLWHERNAWIKHVLQKATAPDFESYLNDQFNDDV